MTHIGVIIKTVTDLYQCVSPFRPNQLSEPISKFDKMAVDNLKK